MPTNDPWSDPIEPQWAHGKRRAAEPARLITARVVEEGVYAAVACPREGHLAALPEAA